MLLFTLLAVALLGSPPLDDGFGLGFARITGAVLVAIAAAGGGWALFLLRSNLTIFPAPTERSTLVDRGPFRVVRHPIYGAVCLGTVGIGLVAVNPLATLVSLAFVPFFMAKTGYEEALLLERFAGYRDYRSDVAYRLLPWVV